VYSRVAVSLADNNSQGMWYLGSALQSSGADSAVSFVTFLILYNNLVPISLYVSLDLIKVTQAKQIELDRSMAYDPAEDDPELAMMRKRSRLSELHGNAIGAGSGATIEGSSSSRQSRAGASLSLSFTNFGASSLGESASSSAGSEGRPANLNAPNDSELKWAKARTSDLNEDLGQIQYIFSDKTVRARMSSCLHARLFACPVVCVFSANVFTASTLICCIARVCAGYSDSEYDGVSKVLRGRNKLWFWNN